MIGSASHYIIKHPLGFHWFSPSGEMPPMLLGGKVGTVMIGSANHYIIIPGHKQPFSRIR